MLQSVVKCSFFISAAIVLIQLFSTFGFTQGSELPLELLQHGSVNMNGVKSMDYPRRMAFPLVSNDNDNDNDIELPPQVEDNFDLKDDLGAQQEDESSPIGGGGMPKWLQMQLQTDNHHQQQQQQQQHSNNYAANLMHKQQQHQHQHQHHTDIRQAAHTVSSSPLRRCAIEITNKIPGICQAMGTIGNACVSGEYLDVFNADCF